jgi:hypothetical protein
MSVHVSATISWNSEAAGKTKQWENGFTRYKSFGSSFYRVISAPGETAQVV